MESVSLPFGTLAPRLGVEGFLVVVGMWLWRCIGGGGKFGYKKHPQSEPHVGVAILGIYKAT